MIDVTIILRAFGGARNIRRIVILTPRLIWVTIKGSAQMKDLKKKDVWARIYSREIEFIQKSSPNKYVVRLAERTAAGEVISAKKSVLSILQAVEKLNLSRVLVISEELSSEYLRILSTSKTKKKWGPVRLSEWIVKVFSPIIPLVVIGGFLLGLISFLEFFFKSSFVDEGNGLLRTNFLTEILALFRLIPNAIFTFLPVYVCYRIFFIRKQNTLVGLAVSFLLFAPPLRFFDFGQSGLPTFLSPGFDIIDKGFFFTLWAQFKSFFSPEWSAHLAPGVYFPPKVVYHRQVLAGIAIGLIGSNLLVFFTKKLPKGVFSDFAVPFLTLFFSFLIMIFFLGPIILLFSSFFSSLIAILLLRPPFSYLGSVLLGFSYELLVIFGLHHLLLPISLNIQSIMNADLIPVIASISSTCQAVACLTGFYSMKTRRQRVFRGDHKESEEKGIVIVNRLIDKEKKSLIFTDSFLALFAGITEPVLYQSNLRKPFLFVSGLIGTAVASVIAALLGVTGVVGVESILYFFSLVPSVIIRPVIPQLLGFFVANICGILITILLVLLFSAKILESGKKNKSL